MPSYHEITYRTLNFAEEERPQFEKMIQDLERACSYWDKPPLRSYAKVLLKIIGHTATSEAGDVVKDAKREAKPD